MTFFFLYLLYAYVQAVLCVRFGRLAGSDEAPPHVFIWMVFAPVLTIALLIAAAWSLTEWLARAR